MTKKLILPILAISTGFLVSCGGGNSTKYKITFAGENYKINGKKPKDYFVEIEKGTKIGKITGIKEEYGYRLPETIKIDAFKEDYTWDKDKGVIDFKNLVMPDKNITITINAVEE